MRIIVPADPEKVAEEIHPTDPEHLSIGREVSTNKVRLSKRRRLCIMVESHQTFIMKTKTLLALASFAIASAASALAGTSYQATGPVLELTDKKIVIQKDTEKWEFARTPETKVEGTLKVGEKVTVHYTMTAASVEVKPAKDAKPEAKPAKK